MAVKEIINGNLLIAKFMHVTKTKGLKYHKDWNWLMPVMRKCIDTFHDNRFNIFRSLHEVNIEKCWKAAVEFIQWANEHREHIEEYQTTKKVTRIDYKHITCE